MLSSRRRWAPLAVAAVLLLLYLLLIPVAQVIINVPHRAHDSLIVPAIALLLAHWSLYSGWAVLGDGPWMPRLAAAVFGLVAPTIAIEWIAPGAPLALLLLLALAYAALVAIPFAIARARGYRCRLPDETPDAITSRQFSLRQIFVLTTVVAAMLTLVRIMGRLDFGGEQFFLLLIFLSPAVITWGAFPLMLTTGQPLGSVGLVGLSALVGVALIVVGPPRPDREMTFALIMTLGVTLAVTLTALRLSGYRLRRQATAPVA